MSVKKHFNADELIKRYQECEDLNFAGPFLIEMIKSELTATIEKGEVKPACNEIEKFASFLIFKGRMESALDFIGFLFDRVEAMIKNDRPASSSALFKTAERVLIAHKKYLSIVDRVLERSLKVAQIALNTRGFARMAEKAASTVEKFGSAKDHSSQIVEAMNVLSVMPDIQAVEKIVPPHDAGRIKPLPAGLTIFRP